MSETIGFHVLGDWKPETRVAIRMVKLLGSAVGTPKFIELAIVLLKDIRRDQRVTAIELIAAVGEAAGTPIVLKELTTLLRGGDYLSGCTLNAIRSIGAIACIDECLLAITPLLRNLAAPFRRAAAEAIGAMGPTAGSMNILRALAPLLHDPEIEPADAAHDAIRAISASLSTEILVRLKEMLRSQDWQERNLAITLIPAIGAPAGTPEILAELGKILRESETWACREAAHAIRGIGAAAATPTILTM
jgi:HEAT repeat protein